MILKLQIIKFYADQRNKYAERANLVLICNKNYIFCNCSQLPKTIKLSCVVTNPDGELLLPASCPSKRQLSPVVNTPPRKSPAPPANSKPPKKKKKKK